MYIFLYWVTNFYVNNFILQDDSAFKMIFVNSCLAFCSVLQEFANIIYNSQVNIDHLGTNNQLMKWIIQLVRIWKKD